MSPPTLLSHPGWSQVAIAFVLVAINSAISQLLQLHVGASLAIAALRCMTQLIVINLSCEAYLPWRVLLLNALAAYEIVITAERRCQRMFTVVFTTMLVSVIPVSILGARFAMDIDPFRSPEQYLPLMTMLCENAVLGISLSLGCVLSKLDVNRIELPGTSHLDRHLLVVEGLHLGLIPTINRMSLMGATAIPSMMIRTILGGTNVEQAVRLQIIITFMMAASTTLSCIVATHLVLWICVDSEQHIRSNCIDTRPHVVRRAFNRVIIHIVGRVEHFLQRGTQIDSTASPSEHSALLNGSGG